MSIVTRTGDQGTTGLTYGHRVGKTHPRIEACGAIDELNAALGLARAAAPEQFGTNHLLRIQKELVALMGEVATTAEDYPRYVKDGYPVIDSALIGALEELIRELESQNISFKGWATPGANLAAAHLDLARTICRRAERRVCELQKPNDLPNPQILIYLNRLADLLWLLARKAETA